MLGAVADAHDAWLTMAHVLETVTTDSRSYISQPKPPKLRNLCRVAAAPHIGASPSCQRPSLTTTQRYLNPSHRAITDAGEALSAYLNAG